MGLDMGFYNNGEDLLSLRNHHLFADLLFAQPVERVSDEYDDVYVDMRTLNGLAEALRKDLRDNGLSEADVPIEVPATFYQLDPRAASPEILLPVYLLLVRGLRQAIYERGPLICAWSC